MVIARGWAVALVAFAVTSGPRKTRAEVPSDAVGSPNSEGALGLEPIEAEHTPPRVVVAGEAVSLEVRVRGPGPSVRRAFLWLEGRGEQAMKRVAEGVFELAIDTRPETNGLAYAIYVVTDDDREVAAFASRDEPYLVWVRPDPAAAPALLIERRPHFVDLDVDGSPSVTRGRSAGDGPADVFWRAHAGYRYRVPRGALRHLGLTFELMRWQDEGSARARGYQLARGELSLAFWRYGQIDLRPAIGFFRDDVVGGGEVALRFGPREGGGFAFGADLLKGAARRVFGRFASGALGPRMPWLRLGTTFVVTDRPQAGRWRFEATADGRVDIGEGYSLRARAGLQSRTSGAVAPLFGGGLDASF
ncbi:MAG: hypothetical protein AAF928_10785 [Myxococcota bacterium]